MFVPHEPELCLDVYKAGDRCVCGRSALVTSHDGVASGYCESCEEKRDKFVNSIIGNIDIQKNKSNISIIVLEELRKNILKERFYYMVNYYFASNQDKPFSEPYEDDDFLEKVYREKINLMKDFILPAFYVYASNDDSKKWFKESKREKNFNDYCEKIYEMCENDDEKLEAIMYKNGTLTLSYMQKHKKCYD